MPIADLQSAENDEVRAGCPKLGTLPYPPPNAQIVLKLLPNNFKYMAIKITGIGPLLYIMYFYQNFVFHCVKVSTTG